MKNLFIASQFEADFFLHGYNQVDNNVYEKEHRVIVMGIGMVNTAISCTKFFSEYPLSDEDEYINIGIAGAVDPNLKIGELVEPGSFSVFSPLEISGASKRIMLEAYPEISHEGIKIASSPQPLWDEVSLEKLQRENVSLVDMEVYAFVQACQEFDISFKVIKGISDHLAKHSQEEFLQNAKQAILSIKKRLLM